MFWAYILAILITMVVMYIAVAQPLVKIGSNGDFLGLLIFYAVWATFISLPAVLIGSLFYEKSLIKSELSLTVMHKVLGIPFFWKRLELERKDSFVVEHYMDTPNIARKKQVQELRAFQNQGHFTLKAGLKGHKLFLIDRHSRRADLKKMATLLSKY